MFAFISFVREPWRSRQRLVDLELLKDVEEGEGVLGLVACRPMERVREEFREGEAYHQQYRSRQREQSR